MPREGLAISHLLFADDVLLFCRGKKRQFCMLLDTMDLFCLLLVCAFLLRSPRLYVPRMSQEGGGICSLLFPLCNLPQIRVSTWVCLWPKDGSLVLCFMGFLRKSRSRLIPGRANFLTKLDKFSWPNLLSHPFLFMICKQLGSPKVFAIKLIRPSGILFVVANLDLIVYA